MTIVNIHEAKSQLSKLIEAVEAGEEIIVARAGKSVVRLVALDATRPPRQLGRLAGRLTVPDDFDDPLPEETLRSFTEGPL